MTLKKNERIGGKDERCVLPAPPGEQSSDKTGCHATAPDQVDRRLSSAKQVSWRGAGDLLQLPWSPRFPGLLVVVDLWAGISGVLIALLSLGVRCIAVACEWNAEARCVAHMNFPNVVHMALVEDFKGEFLRPLLKRREVAGVLVGGGSPCQGNSALNEKRRGLDDSRSHQPIELQRVADEIEALPEVKDRSIRVFRWLENVASAPEDVVDFYSSLLAFPDGKKCECFLVKAQRYGYVSRSRLFWGRTQSATLSNFDAYLPPDLKLLERGTMKELAYVGDKPVPRKVLEKTALSLRLTLL